MGWGILFFVALGMFWLYWHYFEYETKGLFRWLRWSEMWLVSWFVDDDYTIVWQGQRINFKDLMDAMADRTPRELDGSYGLVAGVPMEPLKWPFMALLTFMAFWAYSKGPGTQFRRILNLDGLIGVQAVTFPVIQPFIRFNPSKAKPRPPGTPVPAELPLFAEALGPEEWLAYNHIPIPDGQVNDSEAYMAFARQLGARWRGPSDLAPYKQILLAACCLKAGRKRVEADALLGRIAKCWSESGKLSLNKDPGLLREARKILRDKDIAGKTLANCNQHAFETTALLRALQTAREEGGVLAPAQFLWLRGHDRLLWYPMNNLGRQAYHMEALGAMSHFKAEKLTQRPIPKPKVDNAVATITTYMKSSRAKPVPQLDYTESKKRGIKKPAQARHFVNPDSSTQAKKGQLS